MKKRKQSSSDQAITVPRAITTPSNLLRRWLCPGSARLEAGLPDDDSVDAQAGRLFHRYWANPHYDRAFLTQEQRDLLALTDKLMNDVLNKLMFELEHGFYVEQTFSTRDGRLTGTADRVYVWQTRRSALIADLKSGFAQVERAELNLQLRGYAIIAADNFDLENCYVSLLQPRLFFASDRISLAHYEARDIERSREQINKIIDESEKPDAPLRAGEDQCRYCRAKLICPAFRAALALPVTAFKTDEALSKAKREAEIEKRLANCTDEQLERVLEACALASQIGEPARNEARSRIRDGKFTNFTLGKDWSVRVVKNVRKAIALLSLSGVAKREEVLDACTLALDKIEESYRDRRKLTWKQARTKIDSVLEKVIEHEPRQPRILKK